MSHTTTAYPPDEIVDAPDGNQYFITLDCEHKPADYQLSRVQKGAGLCADIIAEGSLSYCQHCLAYFMGGA